MMMMILRSKKKSLKHKLTWLIKCLASEDTWGASGKFKSTFIILQKIKGIVKAKYQDLLLFIH